ncbi:MAG: hypothetical protein WCC94_02975 [Candidatus Bathyarchaeia archaeon]
MSSQNAEQANTKHADELRKLGEIFGPFMPSMPRYNYWTLNLGKGKATYAFGWTTERDSDGKFSAFIYRIVKKGKTWKLLKSLSYRRRKVAKAKALSWYESRRKTLD